ncbi:CAP domain-containing protein [Jannaschia sp. W003]|uniref:CAP domain-containing protein n=1 Tax=Jannaschia sp. W003 TaxID=2867012 RepID=UPI0021A6C048|nr:CAP domain-containing protein [Jannaschia sp. W003]UWQ22758.1 CAP domain-containing protein [Jannaschia sp. W003]
MNTVIAAALAAATVLGGCASVSYSVRTVPPVGKGDVSAVRIAPARADEAERRALAMVNDRRRRAGLPPVAANRKLQAAAESHARWMARTGTMSHRGAGGSDMLTRMRAAGYRPCDANENVAYGQRTADRVVAGWTASPGHRRNILEDGMQHGAVAKVRDREGTIWWAMVLGKRCGG